jgi:hypothetical protein
MRVLYVSFLICLTTLFQLPSVYKKYGTMIVADNERKIRKKAIVACLNISSKHSLEEMARYCKTDTPRDA